MQIPRSLSPRTARLRRARNDNGNENFCLIQYSPGIVIPSAARDLQLRTERRYYVYIMASRSLNLYTGVTGNIFQRALEHKRGQVQGFTKRYNINRLVYYETFRYISNAIAREEQIKAWTRSNRLALIKSLNPTWQDLVEGWGERVELPIPRGARDDKIQGDEEVAGPCNRV
jgi:putative endonuclease